MHTLRTNIYNYFYWSRYWIVWTLEFDCSTSTFRGSLSNKSELVPGKRSADMLYTTKFVVRRTRSSSFSEIPMIVIHSLV